MVLMNGYTTTPHHRQNRRRERPGSRTRRTITRKSNFHSEYSEGLLDALDNSVPLPSDKSRPSPLMRQNFDQSWERWKAREAEEKALAEMDKMQEEQEQRRLFGGDVDDDELYRLGILYDGGDQKDIAHIVESTSGLCDGPLFESTPLYIIRPGKPRRTRRSKRHSLSLYLSLSNLRDDADIARLLSPSPSHNTKPPIQHRKISIPSSPTVTPMSTTPLPLSLPTSLASSNSASAYGSNLFTFDNTNPHSFDPGDWTFITTTAPPSPVLTSPVSEPETWIFLRDETPSDDL